MSKKLINSVTLPQNSLGSSKALCILKPLIKKWRSWIFSTDIYLQFSCNSPEFPNLTPLNEKTLKKVYNSLCFKVGLIWKIKKLKILDFFQGFYNYLDCTFNHLKWDQNLSDLMTILSYPTKKQKCKGLCSYYYIIIDLHHHLHLWILIFHGDVMIII